jgi:hypothetical protein
MSKDAMFSTTLKKFGDKLIYFKKSDESVYKTFLNGLEEGQLVDVFFDASKDDGSLAQLAKIHKCIREIAKETGHEFEDIKEYVKKKSGLIIEKEVLGEIIPHRKSLGKASKEDLGLVIETIIKLGDLVNVNCR